MGYNITMLMLRPFLAVLICCLHTATPLSCYECTSMSGSCSETEWGTLTECPEDSVGCEITEVVSSSSYMPMFMRHCTNLGDTTAMIRDCDNKVDAGCDTIVHGENNRTTEYCTCTSSLCNGDWVSAGATPSSTSPSPTAPSTTAPTPTSPSTTAPSTSTQTSSTPAPALSYRNIVLIPVIVTHFLTM